VSHKEGTSVLTSTRKVIVSSGTDKKPLRFHVQLIGQTWTVTSTSITRSSSVSVLESFFILLVEGWMEVGRLHYLELLGLDSPLSSGDGKG
jgi:hypothetical protein